MSQENEKPKKLIEMLIEAFNRNTESFNRLLTSSDKVKEDLLNQKRKARIDIYIVALISLFGVILSVSIAYHNSNKQAQLSLIQEKITVLNQQRQDLQQEKENLIKKRDDLMVAMTNIRLARGYGIKYCINGKYQSNDVSIYSRRLYDLDANLISASLSIKKIFAEDVYDRTSRFASFVDADKHNTWNLCDKGEANVDKLRLDQGKIYSGMNKKINAINQKITYINNELNKLQKNAPS